MAAAGAVQSAAATGAVNAATQAAVPTPGAKTPAQPKQQAAKKTTAKKN
jgi:hypothetical protein